MSRKKPDKICFSQPNAATADLGRKLHFPRLILSTTLRLHIVMWSREGKKVILVELTVLWERRCDEVSTAGSRLPRQKLENIVIPSESGMLKLRS